MLGLPFEIELPHLTGIIDSVALLLAANGAPILVNKVLAERFSWPIDNGCQLGDGQRVFGNTKTWRGLCAAICFAVVAALLLDIDPLIGASFGALTMAGDLIASFIKRRLGRIASSRARGFDTIPESLLPVWLLKEPLALSSIDIILIVGIFFLIEEYISPILYKLHLRMRPY